jgi:hypothetical protein
VLPGSIGLDFPEKLSPIPTSQMDKRVFAVWHPMHSSSPGPSRDNAIMSSTTQHPRSYHPTTAFFNEKVCGWDVRLGASHSVAFSHQNIIEWDGLGDPGTEEESQ